MKYRQLGRTGVKVSELCLGTMMFGGQTDETESRRIIDHAFEQGVNFIDTADAYAKTHSEEIVGRAIADKRDHWVLATKLFHRTREGVNEEGLSRRYVMMATERSLKRLGTDHIDIQYLHKPDFETPLEETVGAIGDLIHQGKIRYFGLSNYRAWWIAEIVHLCRELGVPRPIVLQPYYNIMNRAPELEVLPAAHHYGLGIVPYSPIARGVLSGKYPPGSEPPKGSRAGRADPRMMVSEWRSESLEIAQKLKTHAEARGMSLVHFAVAWVLNNR
ncbi:MAG: aldo/keto reductase, partial [Alphaproteobacteria bacterium]